MSTLFKNRDRVHGSVYPGPSRLQDLRYAAKVAASPKNHPTETTAPEPAVGPQLSTPTARRRKERT